MRWFDKRYNSYNYFLKNKFNSKVIKISIDIGNTCPNRDGKKAVGGCIFCSSKGSGDFSSSKNLSIKEQIQVGKKNLSKKWNTDKYILYFQAFTNTYGDIDYLRKKYFEGANEEGVLGIAIATRPDCITLEVLELLKELNQVTYVSVELGLQSSSDYTHDIINSHFTSKDYVKSVKMLRENKIDVITHVILGLPYESKEQMLNTIKFSCDNGTNGIKLQLLHVLKDTKLHEMYNDNLFPVLEKDDYIKTVVDAIEIIPENVVIHRLTGDGDKDLLVVPLYSLDKRGMLNAIEKEMANRDTWQGKKIL